MKQKRMTLQKYILKKYNDLINFFLKNNFVIETTNKKTVNHDNLLFI